jgi:hypothetical protein
MSAYKRGGSALQRLRIRLWQKYEYTCQICKKYVGLDDMTLDHIIPKRRGGTNATSNLQPTHTQCNSDKGSCLPTDPLEHKNYFDSNNSVTELYMCGTLKHEKIAKKLGNPLIIDTGGLDTDGFWNGHAREESLDRWIRQGWKEGKLHGVTSYTEGKPAVEFSVPNGKSLKVLFHPELTKDGRHPVQVVTREAVGDELRVHPRFPRLVDK